MKTINPVICNILNQRADLFRSIKVAEQTIKIGERDVVEIDKFLADNPDYQRFIEIINSDDRTILNYAGVFFTDVRNGLAALDKEEDKHNIEQLSMLINELFKLETDLSEETPNKIKVYNHLSHCLQSVDRILTGRIEMDQWTHRALTEVMTLAVYLKAYNGRHTEGGVTLRGSSNIMPAYRGAGLPSIDGYDPSTFHNQFKLTK